MEIKTYINSDKFLNDLSKINDLLITKSETQITFWGSRVVKVGGYEGSITLDELSRKILSTQLKNPTDDDNAIKFINSLTKLYHFTDLMKENTNWFTKKLIKIREFAFVEKPLRNLIDFHKENILFPEGCGIVRPVTKSPFDATPQADIISPSLPQPIVEVENSVPATETSLSLPQLLAEAKEHFKFNPLKDEILENLKIVLPHAIENKSYSFGGMIMYDTEEETQKAELIEDALESFFVRKDLFKDFSLIKYGGSILGRERMKLQIMNEAEKYVGTGDLSESNQKDILNYIRQITYSRKFLNDPVAYVNQWIKDRETSDGHLFPSDDALNFFKMIM